jgi:hypothetical protein
MRNIDLDLYLRASEASTPCFDLIAREIWDWLLDHGVLEGFITEDVLERIANGTDDNRSTD